MTPSFEFFPPRSDAARARFTEAAAALAAFAPRYMAVTYGAGGSTREGTLDACRALRGLGVPVMAHLTLNAQTRAEVLAAAAAFHEAGVRDLLVLRGDAEDGAAFEPHPKGFTDVPGLMAALDGFTLRVAAYPEAHPDADDAEACLDWLRRKADTGAAEAITQFFFEPETFLRFRDRAEAAGIAIPLVPGLLPVTDWARTEGFAADCGAAVPPDLAEGFARAAREGRADAMALAHACEMADALVAEGCERLHFYTLNRAEPVATICRALGCGTVRAAA